MTWAPDYANPTELKDYLGLQDNARDAFVALWITTVSRNIDNHCGRQFGQTAAAEERFYTPKYDRHELAWFADIDDVQDTTGLTVEDEDGNAVASTDYVLLPRNAAAMGRPYERLKVTACTGELAISVKWGWNSAPSAVKTGLFLQAARLNARVDSPFGIAGSPQEQGELRLLAQLDPDFKTSLKPLRRKWWGGMRLDEVMDEVASVLKGITGLNVFAYPPGTLNAPGGYVSYPQSVDFDETYQRGQDQFTDLPIVLVIGKPTEKSSRDKAALWASGDGPQSVKRRMEAHTWETCDDLTVTSCEFDLEMIAGNPYLAAMFKATVVGPGED